MEGGFMIRVMASLIEDRSRSGGRSRRDVPLYAGCRGVTRATRSAHRLIAQSIKIRFSLNRRPTRSRAEGDGRSAANQCCDMKADLATIGPEATLKARRCVGPTRETWFQCVRPGRQAIEDGKHPVRCYCAEYRLAGPKAVFTIDTEMGAVRAPVSCGPHRAGVYRGRSTMARCQGPAAGDRRPDGLPGPVFAGGDYGRVAQASIRDRDRPHAGQRLRDELR